MFNISLMQKVSAYRWWTSTIYNIVWLQIIRFRKKYHIICTISIGGHYCYFHQLWKRRPTDVQRQAIILNSCMGHIFYHFILIELYYWSRTNIITLYHIELIQSKVLINWSNQPRQGLCPISLLHLLYSTLVKPLQSTIIIALSSYHR